ncbi:hypothetical protein BJX64DRAFT_285560 [Aspergillus heterothallicus]
MSTARVPLVNFEDLQAFHAKHFSTRVGAPEPATEPYDDEEHHGDDGGLGYYPDGVKRTLTDEQIRIFRHSEIHALLRERQIKKENEEYARRISERDEAPDFLSQADMATEDAQAQASDQTTLDTTTKGVKRHADEAEGKDSVVKRQATVSADVSLDYSEEVPSQQPSRKQPVIQFAGRRIVSYDD